jgi:hypothetical protein
MLPHTVKTQALRDVYTLLMAEDESVAVSLPKELLREVERFSPERGVSVSALAAEALRRFLDDDRRYSAARKRSLERMRKAPSLGTNGQITWTREELHER